MGIQKAMVNNLQNRARLNQAGRVSDDLHDVNQELKYENSLEVVKHEIFKHRYSLRDFFRQMDVDNSGTLSFEEFVKGLRQLRISTEHAETIFSMGDSNSDGMLQYNEFIAEFDKVRTHRREAAQMGTPYAAAMTSWPRSGQSMRTCRLPSARLTKMET